MGVSAQAGNIGTPMQLISLSMSASHTPQIKTNSGGSEQSYAMISMHDLTIPNS